MSHQTPILLGLSPIIRLLHLDSYYFFIVNLALPTDYNSNLNSPTSANSYNSSKYLNILLSFLHVASTKTNCPSTLCFMSKVSRQAGESFLVAHLISINILLSDYAHLNAGDIVGTVVCLENLPKI